MFDVRKTNGSSLQRIPVSMPILEGNEKNYVAECLDSNWISSHGKFIGAFERAFASFCGVKHAVSTSNGTCALHLALIALGVGEGDEIIVPTLTYIATANAVRYCNATPILADCDPRTLNVDPRSVESRISPRTKGIIAVHLYGHPADMDPLLSLAKRHGLFVLEDAAEAHGAEYKSRKVGGIGDCAAFSFFGNKIITTGEGGMVTTNDDALAERLRLYRGQGVSPTRRYWHPVVGYNYRMTNLAAAIGLAQLERVDALLAARQRVADWYATHLQRLHNHVTPLAVEPWARAVCWMQIVLLANGDAEKRDAVMARLDEAGIETRPVFYPMHLLPPYEENATRYPNATSCAARGLNLPTHPRLTEPDIVRICGALEDALELSR
jgi:perosamine synthetase